VDLTTEDHLKDAEQVVLEFDFKAELDAYLAGLGADAPVRSLADVIAFNDAHQATELQLFGQETMLAAQKRGPLSSPVYRKALARCHRVARAQGIDLVVRQHRLDAVICPTSTPQRQIDFVDGDGGGADCTTPAAVAGYPHVTVPMGYVLGVPVGLSFFGRAWTEPVLIKAAYAYEQASKARRAPQFLPTVVPPAAG